MPRRRVPFTASAPTGSLALSEAAARAQVLLRERARLLREIQKKKVQLEQVRQTSAKRAEELAAQMAPLLARHDRLLAELKAVFTELLAPGRLSKRTRKEIAQLRRMLEMQGVLEEEPEAEDAADGPREPEEPFDPWRGRDPEPHRPGARSERHRGAAGPAPEVQSAAPAGGERRSIRDLFRALARAIHPDRAQREDERQRRTEVMKEVTRAYEEGDMARLIELENAWQAEQAVSVTGDSVQRCLELTRINRELLNQVRELTRQIRDAKQAAREATFGMPPSALVDQASTELDELEALCNLLKGFRDGKVSLTQVLRGAWSSQETEDAEEALLALLFDDFDEPPAPARPRRRKRS